MTQNSVNIKPSPLRVASLLAKSTSIEELYTSLTQSAQATITGSLFADLFISNLADKQAFSHQTLHTNDLQSETIFDNIHSPTIDELLLEASSGNEPVFFDPTLYYSKQFIDTVFDQTKPYCVAIPVYAPKSNKTNVLLLGHAAGEQPDLDTMHHLLDLLNLASILIDNLHLTQQLKDYATFDHLTGLLNRRAVYEILDREHGRAERYQRNYSILFLDIDNFKVINDCYGHNTGDEALKEIALNASDVLREGDWIGRWGGEEFICILPDTCEKGAENIAQRLCKKITNTQLITASHRLQLTLSIGIACYPSDGLTISTLITHADNGLLHAKNSGKNCFKRATPKAPTSPKN